MCPFCFTTLGLIVAGAVSAGGLAGLTLKAARSNHNIRPPKFEFKER